MITNHKDWKRMKTESAAEIKYVFPDIDDEELNDLLNLYNGNANYVEEVKDDLTFMFQEMEAHGLDPYTMTWEEFLAQSQEFADITHTFSAEDIKPVFNAMVKDPNQLKLDLQSRHNESKDAFKQYKLRAECAADFNKLAKLLGKNIKNKDVKQPDNVMPDVDVTFESDLSLKEIKDLIGKVQDGHVMKDTVKSAKSYTGIRESVQPIHNHSFVKANHLHVKLRNQLTTEMSAILPTGFTWAVKKWGNSSYLKINTTEGKSFKFNIGQIDETLTAKRIIKMVKAKLKINENLDETGDIIESIVDKDWFIQLVGDGVNYTLDGDTDFHGENVALLYVHASDVKFDITNKNAPEFATLNQKFEEYLKTEHPELYASNVEVTTTDGNGELVFTFSYAGDADEAKVKADTVSTSKYKITKTIETTQNHRTITNWFINGVKIGEHEAYRDWFCTVKNGVRSNLRDQVKNAYRIRWDYNGLKEIFGDVPNISKIFVNNGPDLSWGISGPRISSTDIKKNIEELIAGLNNNINTAITTPTNEDSKDNLYGGSAQGVSITDYTEWKQTIIDKYPKAEFVDDGSTESAYDDGFDGTVGYWDKQISSGVILDSEQDLIRNTDLGEMMTTHAEFKAYLESKKNEKFAFNTPFSKEELGKGYEEVVGYDISKDDPSMTAEDILKLMMEYDAESGESKFAKFYAGSTNEAKSKTIGELNDLISSNNKEYGTEFSISGAYGEHELWAKTKDGSERIEAGSKQDIYQAFVKNRFKEKYTINRK